MFITSESGRLQSKAVEVLGIAAEPIEMLEYIGEQQGLTT